MGLRDLPLWLSGYDPKIVENEPRDAIHAMRSLGSAIALAGAVAALNWGMASYAIFGTWAAAVAGGMIGAGAVISIDRTTVFLADSTDPGFFRTAALYVVRFGLILMIAGLSSEFLMARVFSEDGAVLALAQREHSEQERARWVPKQFRADDLHAAANDADAAVVTATKALGIIPPNVQAQSDQAKACRAMHAARFAALRARGVNAVEARKQLAVLAARCDSLSASARQALESYRENARKEIAEAQDRQNKAHAAVAQVETAIARKLSEAVGIERGGITGGSNGVLDAVVNANPTAKRKWWYIFGSLLALECLPLLLKVLSRRSSIGTRILVEEALRVDGHFRRRDEALHAADQRAVFRALLDEARDAAISSDEVQSHLAHSAARYVVNFSALDWAKRLAADLEDLHELRQVMIRRYPDITEQLNAVFDAALDEILAQFNRKPSASRPSVSVAAE